MTYHLRRIADGFEFGAATLATAPADALRTLIDGRPRIGGFVLTKELAPGVLGDRWLALCEADQTSHVVTRLRTLRTGEGSLESWQGRFLAQMERTASLAHPHLLRVETFGLDDEGRPFAISPFTGDSEGVVTLDHLLRLQGGFLTVPEAKRAVEQMLSAIVYAHERGHAHGELTMPEVQIDPRGRVAIDLYGLARHLSTADRGETSLREDQLGEVRAVCRIAYQLLTGLRPEEPVIPPDRVVLGLHHSWMDFFETGLGPVGFTTAEHAMSAASACRSTLVRTGLGRVRSALLGLIGAGR